MKNRYFVLCSSTWSKICIILWFILGQFNFCHAQLNTSQLNKTYAVIIGISQYQNNGIDKLDFADRDAQTFADYLKSKSGGSVSDSNIILLKNETATYTAIYQALDWLLEVCHEGDLVYFYFSGHGDMENNTIYKLGFLLSYNTPKNNYINNAVRIEDLNNYANTLSVKTKARVVLITDACHSGKLAGNENKGTYLVGEQLRTVLNNEIRMSSCQPDQLSAENEKWGGGRGVFSYYLLNGLIGLADAQQDGQVSVKEISDYLDASLRNDLVLKSSNHSQTPIVSGKNDFTLANVDKNELEALKNTHQGMSIESDLPPLPKSKTADFLNNLDSKLEHQFDFYHLDSIPIEEIPFQMIRNDYKESNSNQELLTYLKTNPDALKKFKKNLVEKIASRGDEIINLYLSGDESEMEKRRYYNSVNNDYGVYTKMFEVALKLTDSNSPLANILKIKQHYFAGVAYRIKLSVASDTKEILNKAFEEQQKAFELEENAAYINNELGILYKLKGDYEKAKHYYEKATEIAPTWAIPWSNLSGLYIAMNQEKNALEAVNKSIDLQKNFSNAYINIGKVYELRSNWLFAEENFRKAISLNDRHYLPFERLGNVYTKITRYKEAEDFYYEAAIRKDGFNEIPDNDGDGVPDRRDIDMSIPKSLCILPTKINNNDILTYFALAIQQFNNSKWNDAESTFKKIIAIDESNPLANYYLGIIYFKEKKWALSEYNFKLSKQFHLDEEELHKYISTWRSNLTESNDCIEDVIKQNNYSVVTSNFYLAESYFQWHHYDEAVQTYKLILKDNPANKLANCKLWNLLVSINRYYDAEKALIDFNDVDSEAKYQLNVFYDKAIEHYQNSYEWYLKAANFLYDEFLSNSSYINNNLSGSVSTFLTVKIDDPFSSENKFDFDPIIRPQFKAISYFLKADSLFKNPDESFNLYRKIADIYYFNEDSTEAAEYYNKSIALQGDNASVRNHLIEIWNDNYQFSNAMIQLDTLNKIHEINFKNMILLASYKIRSHQFSEAQRLFQTIDSFTSLKKMNLQNLKGLYSYLSSDYTNALKYYLESLKSFPNDSEAMYTIAKIYLKQTQEAEAFKWLKKSIDAGFKYYWVLKNDEDWNSIRTSPKWKDLTSTIIPKPLPPNLAKENALRKEMGLPILALPEAPILTR